MENPYLRTLFAIILSYTIVLHKLPLLNLMEYVPDITFALKAGAIEIWGTGIFSITLLYNILRMEGV